MQVVIDIDEKDYTFFKEGYSHLKIKEHLTDTRDNRNYIAIANGTPLPKGHGRLGDLDAIWNKLKELEEYYKAEFLKKSNVIHESAMNGRLYGFTNSKFIVQDAPTIIEADKENEDETSNKV